MIRSNSFTRRDVRNAKAIFVPSVPGLKGKTMNHKSKLPREDEQIDIPPNIAKQYGKVTLFIDVMHVNNISYIVFKAYHIGYYQCIQFAKKNKAKFMEAFTEMYNEYKWCGVFRVTQINGDGHFECIRMDLQEEPFQIKLITYNANKCVPRIEQGIQDLKERFPCARMIMKF